MRMEKAKKQIKRTWPGLWEGESGSRQPVFTQGGEKYFWRDSLPSQKVSGVLRKKSFERN